ncbi:hypothetical protein [Sutcliffiella rhizosphaerae]|uniref:Uncharacterized protein n=1 Tax=Sutcliffiella rhizosphaerae TaxID=2880967 RepID=A0ABM8YSF4_9BACI|nr:hypothetical protein [Sutcliffiella rhizosphaerae]CAG9622938.1 hypothetical protein BACCIP111883_03733 [Sutcliffiella rhizosphaerae]
MGKLDKDTDNTQDSPYSFVVTLTLIGVTLIIGFITFISFQDGYEVKKQQEVADYIHSAERIMNQSKAKTDEIIDGFNQNTLPNYGEIELEMFRALMTELNELNAPKNWTEHKESVTNIVSQQYLFFYQYTHHLINLNEKNIEDFKTRDEDYAQKEKNILTKGLDSSNIPYEVNDEGIIRFSIKTY